MTKGPISQFIEHNYRHFNAAALIDAAKGYEAEEAAGIPLNAPHRNYKDKNHKPEVMVALSEFWLLHGFKKENELKETLQLVPELNFLCLYLKTVAIKACIRK